MLLFFGSQTAHDQFSNTHTAVQNLDWIITINNSTWWKEGFKKIGIGDQVGRYCFLWLVIGLKNPDRSTPSFYCVLIGDLQPLILLWLCLKLLRSLQCCQCKWLNIKLMFIGLIGKAISLLFVLCISILFTYAKCVIYILNIFIIYIYIIYVYYKHVSSHITL